MVARPCLDCGEPTPNPRCPTHTAAKERTRPSRRAKGRYDSRHIELRARTLREQPWCSHCKAPDTPDNPLQADHIVPHQWGGKNVRSNYQTLCRRCNAAKRDRMVAPTG